MRRSVQLMLAEYSPGHDVSRRAVISRHILFISGRLFARLLP